MLTIDGMSLDYDGITVLDDVSFAVAAGEVVAVVGASGSGKTSLLRCLAGLARPSDGRATLDGVDLARQAVHERQVGMMFQDYALFPHLDVAENVAFGLRMTSAPDADERVEEVLRWVGLRDLADRDVASLSGGEQQRVALARTLAPRPRLVLLDEPLGALDTQLRVRLLPELADVLADVSAPALYVTHDLSEAFAIGDRVAILGDGALLQIDTPERLWRAPQSETVAAFIGYHSIVDATVQGGVASTPWGAVASLLDDGRHRVAVRPDAIHISPDGDLEAVVQGIRFDTGHYVIEAEALGHPLRITSPTSLPIGERIRVAIDADGLVAVERL